MALPTPNMNIVVLNMMLLMRPAFRAFWYQLRMSSWKRSMT